MSSSKRSYAIASSALALLAVCIVAIFVASSNNDTPTGSNLHRHLTESASSSSSSLLDENRVLPSLFPLTWPSDYLGFTCATLGLLLAAGGGIGK